MEKYNMSAQEKNGMIESKITCCRGMKETIEYDLSVEDDTQIRAELEQNLLDCISIISALENFKETVVE
jgi:DNA-binding SARP family transcriptional activator